MEVMGLVLGQSSMVVPMSIILLCAEYVSFHFNVLCGLLFFIRKVQCLKTFEYMSGLLAIKT